MTNDRTPALEYAHKNRSRFLDELHEFIKIESVSTDTTRKKDIRKAAQWLVDQLHQLDMPRVEIFETSGWPVVYGESLKAGSAAPTVLIYGHYDVQPAEPLDLWESQPFEPAQRGEYLYGRGASDMKGQIMTSLKAIEAINQNGGLPVNIKFLFEGEEEIGSPNLPAFLKQYKDMLKSDLAFNPDTGMLAPDIPTIVYGLRGLAYFELRVYGPTHDLHSGLFGGAIHNPAQALCELIAGMHDGNGQVTLPDYYTKVRPITAEERAELARIPTDEQFYLKNTGVAQLWGEKGYSPVERIGARPTLEVNGLYSGFTGEGSKTVLPAWAMAKISMRLVPDQDPEEVYQQLVKYLEVNAPKTIRWEVKKLAGGRACITNRNTPWIRALSTALETTWGVKPVFRREGGSVPIVADMQEILGIDSVLTGFGLPDDNVHGPNEKLHLPTWYKGIDATIHFFYNLI
jgi:acetylornithine deacetylase/succinyl-diaminopimelate desuccinylase-like protein